MADTGRIMVDELVAWGVASKASAQTKRVFGGKRSCHMTIDSDDMKPLHAFAAKIGMRRAWFQDHPRMPHYDLTEARREAALAAGAVYVPWREQMKARRARRAAAQGQDGNG